MRQSLLTVDYQSMDISATTICVLDRLTRNMELKKVGYDV